MKQLLKKYYLYDVNTEFLQFFKILSTFLNRKLGPTNRKLLRNYLQTSEVRKLHIGCGDNVISGWLNSDLFPKSDAVFHLDATRSFPFADEEFDYIFSEHMIEHLTYAQGMQMLSECHRILRPNGMIRISTPDFLFLFDLYKGDLSDLREDYIDWATRNFIPSAPFPHSIFVINNFVRDWGHRFIYDESILTDSLTRCGFGNVRKCELNQSEEPPFRHLENEMRMPDGFLKLESMTIEATKLAAATNS